MLKQILSAGLIGLGLLALAPAGAWAKDGKGGGKGGHQAQEKRDAAEERLFKPDVLRQLQKDNPALPKNFLTAAPPETPVKLSDGKTYPLYQLDQFLQANFRIEWYARQKEGEAIVSMMEKRLRKLMALPEFRERVLQHKPEYLIAPGGKVSAPQAYDHFRHCTRRIGVAASKNYHQPVGGGSGIGAPSWAVWRAMNIFEHETCHCIGIGHNSGGLSGAIAGTLRDWDRKQKWNYPTIDANTLVVTPAEKQAESSIKSGKGKKGKGGGKGKPGKAGGAGAKGDGNGAEEEEDEADDDTPLDAGPEDDAVGNGDEAPAAGGGE